MEPMDQNIPVGMDSDDMTPVQPVQSAQEMPQDTPVEKPVQTPPAHTYTVGPGSAPQNSPFANSPYVVNRPVTPPPAPQKKPEKVRYLRYGHLFAAMGVMLVICILCCCITAAVVGGNTPQNSDNSYLALQEKIALLEKKLESQNAGNNSGNSVSGTPNVTVDGSLTPAQVYAQNVQSVVAINCTVVSGYSQGASSGSGFIISEDGYIVTNYHVVEGATTLDVVTSESKTYAAEYIGGNEANDIALIKVEAEGLRPVTIGVSSNLIVGDQVVAIGNPLGELASTLTVGYVSAKDRIVTTDGTQINMMQTDAAINPGNSGGPLFNMKGEVIGITSAKYSGTTNSGASIEGIGFAIPTDDVMGMLEDLKEYGFITGGYLGVSISDVGAEASELYGLPQGVLVRKVEKGSCAEAAGIRVQDIIVNLGGYDISNTNDLSRALNKLKAGETVSITVYRGGSEKTLSVTLDEKPQQSQQSSTTPGSGSTQPGSGGSIEDWFDHFFGN